MATFTVNGKTVTVEKNQKLMRYLRDEMQLLSVKDGCAEGACGACTIIIDGKRERVTISAGLAMFDPEDPDISDLLSKAERKLNKSKREGKNKVSF